jgi:hypothetical protein
MQVSAAMRIAFLAAAWEGGFTSWARCRCVCAARACLLGEGGDEAALHGSTPASVALPQKHAWHCDSGPAQTKHAHSHSPMLIAFKSGMSTSALAAAKAKGLPLPIAEAKGDRARDCSQGKGGYVFAVHT